MKSLRVLFSVAFALLTFSPAFAADPWTPFRTLVGEWRGKVTMPAGGPRVTRVYETAEDSRGLIVTSRFNAKASPAGAALAVRGTLRLDSGALVLEEVLAGGDKVRYAFDHASDDGLLLVFDADQPAGHLRKTLRVASRGEFTETVEHAGQDGAFALVSETRFIRQGWRQPAPVAPSQPPTPAAESPSAQR